MSIPDPLSDAPELLEFVEPPELLSELLEPFEESG
jgi:hypothetical protein